MRLALEFITASLWLFRDIALIVALEGGIIRGILAPRYKQKDYIAAGWLVWSIALVGVVASLNHTDLERSGILFSTPHAIRFLLLDALLLTITLPLSRKAKTVYFSLSLVKNHSTSIITRR